MMHVILLGQPAVVDILHTGISKKYVWLRPVAVMKGRTVKASRSGHLVAVFDKSLWPMWMRRSPGASVMYTSWLAAAASSLLEKLFAFWCVRGKRVSAEWEVLQEAPDEATPCPLHNVWLRGMGCVPRM